MNKGRRDLKEPEILAPIYPRKLTLLEQAFFNFESYSFNKEALELEDKIIDERQKPITDAQKYDNERRYLLMHKGLSKVKAIHAKTSGRKIVFGFAFENSKAFYPATDENIKLQPLDLKEGNIQYGHFLILDSSSTKKLVGNNIPIKLDAWDKIEFPTLRRYP